MYDLFTDLKLKLKNSYFDRKLTDYEIQFIHDQYLENIFAGLDPKHAFKKAIDVLNQFQFK